MILDGKKVNIEECLSNPENIEKIEVLKEESAIALYGEEGKDGVIICSTKKQKLNASSEAFMSVNEQKVDPLYVKDGVIITSEEMNKINPQDILLINVIKDGPKLLKYKESGKNGVVEIITKSNKK